MNNMELNMAENKPDLDGDVTSKLSARMSVFAWIICAMLGWALAFTSFATLTGSEEDVIVTAQNEPTAEDAANLEQILPAAGPSQESNKQSAE